MTDRSRRDFLLRTGRFSAAALLAGTLPPPVPANPLGKPVGIQLYAVKDGIESDPAATLHAIRQIGFGEVETAGFGKLSAKEFRALLDEAGLKCPSAHLSFEMDRLGAAFEAAHQLGAHYAASGSLQSLLCRNSSAAGCAAGARQMSLEGAQRTAELANRIGTAARRAGLQYVYHNHDFEFTDVGGGLSAYDVLLKETDADLVRFEIDCGWMVLGGRDPRDYFRRFPHRIPMIHVKDFLPEPKASGASGAAEHRGAELGHGIIDYRPIFTVAEKSGLEHYFAEQEGPFARMTQIEAARNAYAYLRNIS
jgi:sugar phosphate isomerase/epimerase